MKEDTVFKSKLFLVKIFWSIFMFFVFSGLTYLFFFKYKIFLFGTIAEVILLIFFDSINYKVFADNVIVENDGLALLAGGIFWKMFKPKIKYSWSEFDYFLYINEEIETNSFIIVVTPPDRIHLILIYKRINNYNELKELIKKLNPSLKTRNLGNWVKEYGIKEACKKVRRLED